MYTDRPLKSYKGNINAENWTFSFLLISDKEKIIIYIRVVY